jgi:tRNA pseudouridine55 synthase
MASGFFCIDKPPSLTSHDVVARMRKILSMRKVGHSGTLDPMATGVLIIGCGTSTRLLDYVQDGSKEYVADIKFGMKTSSGDAHGETIDEVDMSDLTREEVEQVLPGFIGTISQVPPMVSAIKVDGKKLYEYEREGISIDRKARDVVIDAIELEKFDASEAYPTATIRVTCHAGTYIRTLAEDIAAKLDGYAYLTGLQRTKNGNVNIDDTMSLEELSSLADPFTKMISPHDALSHLPSFEITETQAQDIIHGKGLICDDDQQSIASQTDTSYFFVYADVPRKMIAVFDSAPIVQHRSRCVVFLDDNEA